MSESDDITSPRQCCACGQVKPFVRNYAMLPYRCAVPGHGWGCFGCGAPPDGATAYVCDACAADAKAELTLAYRGRFSDGTEPIEQTKARGEFGHDMSKHPEATRQYFVPEDFDNFNFSDEPFDEDFDDEPCVRCEGCGVNLEDESCLCGPAGPKIDSVWTGQNGREEVEPQPERERD